MDKKSSELALVDIGAGILLMIVLYYSCALVQALMAYDATEQATEQATNAWEKQLEVQHSLVTARDRAEKAYDSGAVQMYNERLKILDYEKP